MRVEISDDVIYQEVRDEVVLLNLESQQYFGLDSVGADVWKLLKEHGDSEAVVQGMKSSYRVDEAKLRSDVDALVADMVQAGLVRSFASGEGF